MTNLEEFLEAIENGDIKTFRKHWKEFEEDKFGTQEYNVLQYAVYTMQPNLVSIILDSEKYDIDYKNRFDETAIVIAMNEFSDDAEEIAEMIFKYHPNVDVDIADSHGRNAVLAGMMSGISSRYIMMASDRTKNLEQFDHEMKETVIDACIRNEGMYRQHAQILASYIRRGAKVSGQQIYKMMELTKSRKLSSVWKAIDGREDLYDIVIKIATEMELYEFLPEELKELFVF